jgi:hypothetical protein
MDETTKKAVTRIEGLVEKIFDTLNGKEGLVTKTELNEQSIKRLWWAFGIVVILLSGVAGRVIYAGTQ